MDALDLLLLLGMLWEGPEEQDCCPSTCSAEVGLYKTDFVVAELSGVCPDKLCNGSLVPSS